MNGRIILPYLIELSPFQPNQRSRLAGKMKYLTDVTDRISVGDLDAEIVGIQSDDEIGELASALKRMQASIRLAVQRLRERR